MTDLAGVPLLGCNCAADQVPRTVQGHHRRVVETLLPAACLDGGGGGRYSRAKRLSPAARNFPGISHAGRGRPRTAAVFVIGGKAGRPPSLSVPTPRGFCVPPSGVNTGNVHEVKGFTALRSLGQMRGRPGYCFVNTIYVPAYALTGNVYVQGVSNYRPRPYRGETNNGNKEQTHLSNGT